MPSVGSGSGAISFSLLILLFGISSPLSAFPQEQLTEELPITEKIDKKVGDADIFGDGDDDEVPLQDQMDKYADVPYITGNNFNCKCGMALERISGGENAEISQYPWTTLLYSVESETYKIPYCGGALINNQYVVTASHCVDGMDPKKIEVVLREQNVSMSTEEDSMLYNKRSMVMGGGGRNTMSVIRIGVDRVIKHPKYSRNNQDNDIALIRLKVRVPLQGFHIAPICVPQATATFSQGVYATVAGYGAVSESETPALTLRMAEVRVLSNELCNTRSFHNGHITSNMLCGDPTSGKGPCAGDTGGPLMIRSSRDSNRQVLLGLASWSSSKITSNEPSGCLDPATPAVYTRVSNYESWIKANTQDAMWCSS